MTIADAFDNEHFGLQAGSPPTIYYAMALLIAAGLGIAVAPSGLIAPFAREFNATTIALKEDWTSRELRIYYPKRNELRSAAQLLLDHLIQCASGVAAG